MQLNPMSENPRVAAHGVPLQESLGAEGRQLQSAAADVRQDNHMASDSVEGRPPTHWQRNAGWIATLIGSVVLVVGIVTWIMVSGATSGTVVGFGVLFVTLLLIGGWPVLAAGLLRGGEESAARRAACVDAPQQPVALSPADRVSSF